MYVGPPCGMNSVEERKLVIHGHSCTWSVVHGKTQT